MAIKKRFAVIGLGHFGEHAARTLHEQGREVIALDADPDKVQRAAAHATLAAEIDATSYTALKNVGVGEVDAAIISLGERMDVIILAALHVKDLGVPFIAVKALSEDHGRVLERIGVSQVIHPEKEMAIRLANKLARKDVIEYLPLMSGYSVTRVQAPPEFVGRSLRDLALRNTLNVNLVGIQHQDNTQPGGRGQLNIVPRAEDVILEGDMLILLGEDHHLDRITDIVKQKARSE